MLTDNDVIQWKNVLADLFPPGRDGQRPDASTDHLAAVIMILSFDSDAIAEVYDESGNFIPAKLRQMYPGLDATLATDARLNTLTGTRRTFAVVNALWRALVEDYEPGPCPAPPALGNLVEFTKTFKP